MSLLSLENLSVRRAETLVVDGVSLTVQPGEFLGLLGPNGAGKTTLLRAALGFLPHQGRSSLAQLTPAARARAVAFLPQRHEIAWPVSVENIVALGRAPHLTGRPSAADAAAVTRALDRLGLSDYRARIATALSGGEQARVLIARCLAQDTPLLLADEPIAGLDPAQQIRSMQVFHSLAAEGRSVLASLHDLGLAARHCTRLVVIDAGRIAADGPPGAVLTADLMAQVFGVTCWRAETESGLILQPLAAL